MGGRLFVIAALAGAVPFIASAQSWTNWERQNSVTKSGDWMVIKQPGAGFCYLKQSYNDQTGKMELSMKADYHPFVPLPFYRGLDGDVIYRVDDGALRIIPQNRARNPLLLSKEIVPELKSGSVLTIRVKPVGRTPIEQRFSLRGFTAATAWLNKPVCN
ncbi:MAG: hypothetical protein HOO19_16410 [Rhodospirillaceae bacterium]|jgi:invasion protein IalB|nr:hypothetical protein [Rhodospirillaceae bacterium]MBT3884727.1 hypothetical protein [Rhodospirillaceae bacterium]MBT4118330.1 hypothetical protein [Rhodospirillaceae bacterium]MBT4671287.1 hypothetical protein [Rhodospirillaceae bacterium]MBT4750920.1 hypothetical protein [Rhodospirillaceae bacterium]